MKKNSFVLRTLLISTIVLSVASFATASVDVGLNGQYWFGSLKADVTTNVPWGERGTLTITDDTWTQEWDDQDGHHTFISDYTVDVQSDGSINIGLSSGTYNVAFNGDVMVHADAAADSHNRLGIDIFARKASNVANSDIIGSYSFFGHQLNSVDRSDSDEWGSVIFTNSSAAFKYVNDQGHSQSGSMTWTLDDVNEIVHLSGQASQNGLLLGKGSIDVAFQVLPSEGVDNDLGYNVFIKKTSSTIVPADIAGTYQVRFLESGPDGEPYTCYQGTVVFDANGTFAADTYYSDSEHDTPRGTFKIGPGNTISLGGMPGIISTDKNLIFAPEYTYKHHPRESTDWLGGLFFIKDQNSTPVFQFGSVSGSKAQNLVITDPCGVLVSFSLTGGGYGEIAGGANFDQITLYDTGDKSQLTISTKGKNVTSVGDITVNGSLKGITAKTTKLRGSIMISGALGSVTLADIRETEDHHLVSIGPSSNQKATVTIVFGEVEDLNIMTQMPIKSITASDWWGYLTAPSIGSITAKNGDVAVDINVAGTIGAINTGSLGGSWNCKSVASITTGDTDDFYLTLTQEPNTKIPALGKLSVTGELEWSRIISAGNIGTITVGAMQSSSCFAGVADACLMDVNANDSVLDLPSIFGNTFDKEATIGSFAVKGIKGQDPNYFINSNIAAYHINNISVAYPEYSNFGAPFGFAMEDDPTKSLTIIDSQGKHSWKGYQIGAAIDWLHAMINNDMDIRRD